MPEAPIARFKVMGFHVNVRPGFLMLCAVYLLLGLSRKDPLWSIASFAAIVFVSIVVHELGHALMCRRLKVRVSDVEIHGFGGHVMSAQTTARNQFLISIAGPGAGLSIGLPMLIPFLMMDLPPVAEVVVGQIVWVNVGWSLVNLIPMKPLDGGQAFHSIMDMYTDARQAAYITGVLGLILGIVIAVVGWQVGAVFLAIIGVYVAYNNFQAIQRSQRAFR